MLIISNSFVLATLNYLNVFQAQFVPGCLCDSSACVIC